MAKPREQHQFRPYAPLYLVDGTSLIDWWLVKRAALRRARYYSIHDKPTRRELRDSLEITRYAARKEEARFCQDNGFPVPAYDRRAPVPSIGLYGPEPKRKWA